MPQLTAYGLRPTQFVENEGHSQPAQKRGQRLHGQVARVGGSFW
jgi:hypothetical protein